MMGWMNETRTSGYWNVHDEDVILDIFHAALITSVKKGVICSREAGHAARRLAKPIDKASMGLDTAERLGLVG